MALRGGFLLLSLVLGDAPTILAAAQVLGFVPTKVNKGDIIVNPPRLFDVAHSIHEKSSKLLKEHPQEPEGTASQLNSDIPPYGYKLTRNNQNTDMSAFPSHSSHTSLVDSADSAESSQYPSSDNISGDLDDYGDESNENTFSYSQCYEENGATNCKHTSEKRTSPAETKTDEINENIGYSLCYEENGDINCKYVSEKHKSPAETKTSLNDSNIHRLNNGTAVKNFVIIQNDSTVEVKVSVSISLSNKTAGNDTHILGNITAILDTTTENPVHGKAAEPTTTEHSEASTVIVAKDPFPAPHLVEVGKTDSHSIADYNIAQIPHSSYILNQDYQAPIWNPNARDMCFNCGPNAYCDTTQDPKVCVCHFGLRGIPPDCYQPSGDELLHSYRLLLGIHSDKQVSSTKPPAAVNSKEQYPTIVLQENKGSTSPKL